MHSNMYRAVKASSPWLNVILIVGVIIRLPVPLLNSLSLSTNKYMLDVELITPLCYVSSNQYNPRTLTSPQLDFVTLVLIYPCKL